MGKHFFTPAIKIVLTPIVKISKTTPNVSIQTPAISDE